MENIIFDVASKFDLPYNCILGHPHLTKFMAIVHYAYFILKRSQDPLGSLPSRQMSRALCIVPKSHTMPQPQQAEEEKSLELSAYPTTKQRIVPDHAALTKTVRLRDDPEKVVKIGGQLSEK
ncbi:unnamed protein product [Urochloa humidicola]